MLFKYSIGVSLICKLPNKWYQTFTWYTNHLQSCSFFFFLFFFFICFFFNILFLEHLGLVYIVEILIVFFLPFYLCLIYLFSPFFSPYYFLDRLLFSLRLSSSPCLSISLFVSHACSFFFFLVFFFFGFCFLDSNY